MGLGLIFKWVLRLSLIASFLVGFILLVKYLFKNKWNARWQYFIWFLLLVRLLIPIAPSAAFSIFNLYTITARNIQLGPELTLFGFGSELNRFMEQPSSLFQPIDTAIQVAKNTSDASDSTMPPLWLMVPFYILLWFAGVEALGISYLFFHFKFRRRLKKSGKPANLQIQRLVSECRLIMGIRREVPVIQTELVKNPALYGFFKPRILVPAGIENIIDQKGIRYILLHELAHLKRKDIAVNWVIGFLRILHWFNPILHFAFRKFRQDQEMACDALALSFIAQEERISYGLTIIDLLRASSGTPRLPMLTGILDNRAQIKRRIRTIAVCGRNPYQWSLFALIIITIIGFLVLTDARAGWGDRNFYPFVNDPKIIGKWQGVDFVKRIEQFQPGKRFGNEELPGAIYFSSRGMMPKLPGNWTKGLIINRQNDSASKYLYKQIDGEAYLFLEWKDNIEEPVFYVLRKENDRNYQENEIPQKTDQLEYPFVNDPEVIGKWRSVDFVREISQFTPGEKFGREELYLKELVFLPQGITPDSDTFWTKGIWIDQVNETASHYQINKINGSTYMFFEWKSGDYTFRGMKPYYYVLKKVN